MSVATSVLGPLREPRLRRLVGAQFLSESGDGIVTVALPLFVFAETDSALWTSIVFGLQMAAGLIAGVLGGIAADAFDRQRVLLVSYAVRGFLLLLAFVMAPIAAVVVLGVLARGLGQGDNPSFDALMPDLATNNLQQILALRRFIQAVSITVGPAIGAVVASIIGPQQTLGIAAMLFAAASALIATLAGIDAQAPTRKADIGDMPVGERFNELLKGITVAGRIPRVRRLLAYWSIEMAAVAVVLAAAIVWFERTLDVSEIWYGLSVSAYGIGSAVGLAVAGSLSLKIPLPRLLVCMAPIYAVCCAIGIAVEVPWLLPVGWLLWGIALGPEMILGEMFFVSAVPVESRGRAFAGLGVATTAGMALGYFVAGPLLETVGARWSIAGAALCTLLLPLMWIGPARRPTDWHVAAPSDTERVPSGPAR